MWLSDGGAQMHKHWWLDAFPINGWSPTFRLNPGLAQHLSHVTHGKVSLTGAMLSQSFTKCL